ncbi:MAG: porphobilinogen synthase [Coriobacteriia bacterium]|nr:porphobilinogen synthase [Coriobacteriia bacterium]
MEVRTRRLRSSEALRRLTRETRLSSDALIYPLFVRAGNNVVEDLPSMVGQTRFSPDTVNKGVEAALDRGVRSFLLFGLPDEKDEAGSGAYAPDGVVQEALRNLKRSFGQDVCLITDLCLCEYTSHGHCGVIKEGQVDNDLTLPLLVQTALSQAEAGADIVAPSGMMDLTVVSLREGLDGQGFKGTPIMSYAAKYASAFYGPFRDAAGSAPQFGDRKSYQMDYHNAKEALWRISADIEEGADLFIVKPALANLDIIARAADEFALPLAAYSVSGEYAMIQAAASLDLIDGYKAMCETAVSIFRAGANMLITYFAIELAEAISRGEIG